MLRAIKVLSEIAEEHWELFILTLAHWTTGFPDEESVQRYAAAYRAGMSARDYLALIAGCESTDVTDLLSQVATPTLIIQDPGIGFFQQDSIRNVAAVIPGAQVLTVSGMAAGGAAARDFLESSFGPEHHDTGATPGGFRTILFTDLVGHTEMMQRLGDAKGRDVLREHERITRETLKQHGGTEVKTMGDGFMASFGSVTKAVECAIALQRAFAEREGEPLSVRVGLNAGEPIEEDGDLFGATVILASRIAAKADGGEILVADTVRGLCSGKGFLFADRGEFVAKGFEEPVRIYEVRWRDR
jgi:class 3 adenylate cyclase